MKSDFGPCSSKSLTFGRFKDKYKFEQGNCVFPRNFQFSFDFWWTAEKINLQITKMDAENWVPWTDCVQQNFPQPQGLGYAFNNNGVEHSFGNQFAQNTQTGNFSTF